MLVILGSHYQLAIFIFLALVKGLVELWVKPHCHSGGQESSQMISRLFIVLGSITPVLIFLEILWLGHSIPLNWCLVFAVAELLLLGLRIVSVRQLGSYYSVNVRIVDDHRLIRDGIYKYLRHPIYLVGLLENICYPMASGAYFTMAFLVLAGTPVILLRRIREEEALLVKLGDEYEEYRKATWF